MLSGRYLHMSLAVSLQNLARLVRFTPSSTATATGGSAPGRVSDRGNLLQAQRQMFELFQSIVSLDKAVNGSSSLRLALPVARSDPGLALDLNSYAARLNSSEEINATPTSFSPFGPDWLDGSTSPLTVTGVYDGSDGSGDLTFEVRRAGVRGVDRPRIRAYDPQGNVLVNFTVRENHALDRLYSLNNGLSVTVGDGFLLNRDTAVMQIFDSVGSSVDPAQAFNGLRNNNPNLQFGLPGIVNGSFQLNGEPIAVAAGDSINNMITRINQSAAGVTASFNPGTELIEFVQNTAGSIPGISLTGDDSGFLQATKLSSAVVTPGKDPDNERPLSELAIFAAAQNGSFTINDQAIALDVQNDSLDDVIARINGADAGAIASFDPGSGQVTLTAADGVSRLNIDSNGTEFLAALNLPEGQVDTEARRDGVNSRRVKRIVSAVGDVANGLNTLFSDGGLLNGKDARVIALRGQLEAAITGVLGGGDGLLDSNIGLRFRSRSAGGQFGDFVSLDRRRLTRLLQRQGSRVAAFFNGDKSNRGFSAAVASTLDGSIRALSNSLGSRGSLLDVRA